MTSGIHDHYRPYAPPQRVEKVFVVTGTAKGFATVVELAAARLCEKFTDGWYGVKCLDPHCQAYAIVKQWGSKVDPERTHEREIVFFFVPGTGGEKLRVTAGYTQFGDAPNEQAELALSVIAAHYPESGLDAVQSDDPSPAQPSPVVDAGQKDYQYWKETHQQAQASGNVGRYLQQRDISRSTYYDNVKRHGLSGKAGQKPDTKPDTWTLE